MGTFPLQLLGPPPFQPPAEPADAHKGQTSNISAYGAQAHACTIYIHKSEVNLRASELKDIADGLLEYHYDCHLDEQVCETSTQMTLKWMVGIIHLSYSKAKYNFLFKNGHQFSSALYYPSRGSLTCSRGLRHEHNIKKDMRQ